MRLSACAPPRAQWAQAEARRQKMGVRPGLKFIETQTHILIYYMRLYYSARVLVRASQMSHFLRFVLTHFDSRQLLVCAILVAGCSVVHEHGREVCAGGNCANEKRALLS